MSFLNEMREIPAAARREREREIFPVGLLSELCANERAAAHYTQEHREKNTRPLNSTAIPSKYHAPAHQYSAHQCSAHQPPPPQTPAPQTPAYQPPTRVLRELRTTEKAFVTNPNQWRGRSSYFDYLFSGKMGDPQQHLANSYFIETDPELFVHVLRYLRTGVLPIFYDEVKGHDFALYQALLGEAEYYHINRLCRWIKDKKYLEVVTVQLVSLEPKPAFEAVVGDGAEVPFIPETSAEGHERSPEDLQAGVVRKEVVVFDHELCVHAYREKASEDKDNQTLAALRDQLPRSKGINSGGKPTRSAEQDVSPLEALD